MASNGDASAVDDLWGSGDEASDGADDELLQIPPEEEDPSTTAVGVERSSSRRSLPGSNNNAAAPPARRHIPSFQGAFSQARINQNASNGYAMREGAFGAAGASGTSTAGPSGHHQAGAAHHLALPLTSSALAANIDLSSLPSLPDPLSTNYPDLPPDAARFLNSLTAQQHDVDQNAQQASQQAGQGAQQGTGEQHQDDLARLSAALGPDWSALTAVASVGPAASSTAAEAQSPRGSRRPRRRGEAQPPAGQDIETTPMSRHGSGAGDLFLPPHAQVLQADERYSTGALSDQRTPHGSQPTTPHLPDTAGLPPFPAQTAGQVAHATATKGGVRKGRGAKGKAKVSFSADAQGAPGFPAANGDEEMAEARPTSSRRGAKRKLPPKAVVARTPAYRSMQMANHALELIGVRDASGRNWDQSDPATAAAIDKARRAAEDWENEVKLAADPNVAIELHRKATRHTAHLRRMRDALTGELVRLQIEESILRNVRGIAKDQTERLSPLMT